MKRILIQNGTIYDGLGGQPYQADLLVQDGRIGRQLRHQHDPPAGIGRGGKGVLFL